MVRKRGKIDFFKKTKMKKKIITKFINLYNSYLDSKDYECITLRYNIEFDDNLSDTYSVLSPRIHTKIEADSNYKWLWEIHNKILPSSIDFERELSNHKITIVEFEFLNDLDKQIKEDAIQKSIDEMERENAVDILLGRESYAKQSAKMI